MAWLLRINARKRRQNGRGGKRGRGHCGEEEGEVAVGSVVSVRERGEVGPGVQRLSGWVSKWENVSGIEGWGGLLGLVGLVGLGCIYSHFFCSDSFSFSISLILFWFWISNSNTHLNSNLCHILWIIKHCLLPYSDVKFQIKLLLLECLFNYLK